MYFCVDIIIIWVTCNKLDMKKVNKIKDENKLKKTIWRLITYWVIVFIVPTIHFVRSYNQYKTDNLYLITERYQYYPVLALYILGTITFFSLYFYFDKQKENEKM